LLGKWQSFIQWRAILLGFGVLCERLGRVDKDFLDACASDYTPRKIRKRDAEIAARMFVQRGKVMGSLAARNWHDG
jgi:hypothetical protein